MADSMRKLLRLMSLPARGVWIEILVFVMVFDSFHVAPRKGSVD